MANTTASAFLGLTLACARCHDHKYDAIPTRDYYRVQCAFTTTGRAEVALSPRAEAAQFRDQEAKWNERLKAAEGRLNEWLGEQKKAHVISLRSAKIDALKIGDADKKVLKDQPDSDAAKKLSQQYEKDLKISDEEYRKAFSDEARAKWDALKTELEAVRGSRPHGPPTALAIVDK